MGMHGGEGVQHQAAPGLARSGTRCISGPDGVMNMCFERIDTRFNRLNQFRRALTHGRHAHRAASPSPRRRLTAREMEAQAAAAQAVAPAPLLPAGEAMAMLARRGFRPEVGRPDLPFARDLDREAAERLGELLGHYSFRLFLRGAVQRGGDFTPGEATRYLTAPRRRRWPTRWSSWASWSARHATATGSSAGRRASARPSSGTWPASCAAVWAATSPPA